MKINATDKNNFKGVLNNKLLLKGLEGVADHSATFTAASALVMSLTLRPFVISKTPQVEKENKQYSVANSVSSGITKFLTVEALAYPVEKAVLAVEKNRDTFLNNNGKEFFKKSPEAMSFVSQLLKQGTSILSAIPKSLISIYMIPFFMDTLFKNSKNNEEKKDDSISFKGNSFLTKIVSNCFNNEKIQNFAENNVQNSKNITRNIMIAGDTLLCGFSAFNIKRNKKIEDKRKNNLIYNNVLSTAFSIGLSCLVDKGIQNKSGKIIEAFKKANKSNPKLEKYIQGINILRPVVIFSLVYYSILPVFSNFFAQKISNKVNKTEQKSNFLNFQEFKSKNKQYKI